MIYVFYRIHCYSKRHLISYMYIQYHWVNWIWLFILFFCVYVDTCTICISKYNFSKYISAILKSINCFRRIWFSLSYSVIVLLDGTHCKSFESNNWFEISLCLSSRVGYHFGEKVTDKLSSSPYTDMYLQICLAPCTVAKEPNCYVKCLRLVVVVTLVTFHFFMQTYRNNSTRFF